MRGDLITTYKDPLNDEIYSALLSLHNETGISMTALSLLYFVSQPFPSVAIASFTNDTQLNEGLGILKMDENKDLISSLHALRRDLY